MLRKFHWDCGTPNTQNHTQFLYSEATIERMCSIKIFRFVGASENLSTLVFSVHCILGSSSQFDLSSCYVGGVSE